jgi:hypothetical protein
MTGGFGQEPLFMALEEETGPHRPTIVDCVRCVNVHTRSQHVDCVEQ